MSFIILPKNAAKDAVLIEQKSGTSASVDDGGGSITVDGGVSVVNFPTVQPVNDNGGSLTVDGTIDVGNFPSVQPVNDNGGSLTVDDGGANIGANTNQLNGVPESFTKITSNTSTELIDRGSLNKLAFYPRILNEHVESSREIQGTVTSSNIVGQIFKASKDNISALMLTVESAAGILLDDFEGYADSAALQVEWVESGVNPAILETTIVKTGSKAMSLPCEVNGEEWVDTITAVDYTGFTGTFDAYFTNTFDKLKVSVFIGDGTNTKSFQLIQSTLNSWQAFEVNEAAMSEDGGGTTNVLAITEVGFRVDTKSVGKVCIIDNLIATPPGGEIEIKLWDMGADIPVTAVNSIDDGTQYEQIGSAGASSHILSLEGGKRAYHIHHFTCGVQKNLPTNEVLNIDHYYLVELKWIDTDVAVYGPDPAYTTNYYTNGFAFTAPDETTAITATGTYSDIMFGIYSAQRVFFTKVKWRFDAAPNGDASVFVFLEDENMEITGTIVDHEDAPEQLSEYDLNARPMELTDGGKLEFYYNDDLTDSVTKISGSASFLYIPPTVHG